MIAAIYARKSPSRPASPTSRSRSRARSSTRASTPRARAGPSPTSTSTSTTGSAAPSSPTGPGFLRLMNALKPRPPFQVLVMSEESRLGREAIETAYALKQLVKAGVRVFFYLEDRERTLDSPTDKIMLSLTAFADELEREKARQRTLRRDAAEGAGGPRHRRARVRVRQRRDHGAGPDGKRIARRAARINDAEARSSGGSSSCARPATG